MTPRSGSRDESAGAAPDDAVDDKGGAGGDDPAMRAMRAVWLTMRDEAPPDGGLAELLAAARHKAEAMRPGPTLWQRMLAMMRRPPVLALATALVLIGGAVIISRRAPQDSGATAMSFDGSAGVRKTGEGEARDGASASRNVAGGAAADGQAAKLGQATVMPGDGSAPAVEVRDPAGRQGNATPPPSSGALRLADGDDAHAGDATPPPSGGALRLADGDDAHAAASGSGQGSSEPRRRATAGVPGHGRAPPEPAVEGRNKVARAAAGPRSDVHDGAGSADIAGKADSAAGPPARDAEVRDQDRVVVQRGSTSPPRATISAAGSARPQNEQPPAAAASSEGTDDAGVAPASPGPPPRGLLAKLYEQCESAARRGDCAEVRRVVDRITRADRSYKARIAKDPAVAKCLAE